MSALMLDTKGTFDGLVRRYSADPAQAERILSNSFYRNISGALSGTQEYMASEKLYKMLLSPSKGIGRAVNVATTAVMRQVARVVGSEVIADALAFFKAFEGMEEGFKERARAVDRLLRDDGTAFVLVASPKADTVAEAGFFADELARKDIAVRGLIVNRTQPSFGVALEVGRSQTDGVAGAASRVALSAAAVAARADTLDGTALGDHYRCLADSLHLAQGEAEHLSGLAERVAPAPVVKVPIQPFEVSDLRSLEALAAVVFADSGTAAGQD